MTFVVTAKVPFATGADAADVELLLAESDFVAVSTTRNVFPTSAATGLYVAYVAPEMLAQWLPLLSHRCHWYVRPDGDGEYDPAVIVVATLFSLLVSFTLTPLLAGRWSVKRRSPAVPVWARWFQSAFESTARFYHGAILPCALRNRILVPVLCGILVVGAIALVPLGLIGSEFVPQSSTGVLSGSLSYPVGTPLATTQAGLQKLGVELLKIPNVVAVLSTAGAKPSGGDQRRAQEAQQRRPALGGGGEFSQS